jgi:hypothetical protein
VQRLGRAFVIMQIGDADLEQTYGRAIIPALERAGRAPHRVDTHNRGGVLTSEIVAFIEESDVLVADLTHERPNCYLEVGYALGAGRASRLVLTARCDHMPDGLEHRPGGPKVHFGLAGYDILYWDPGRLAAFSKELEKRVLRRLTLDPKL